MEENYNFEGERKLPPDPGLSHNLDNNGYVGFLPRGFNEKTYKERTNIMHASNTAGVAIILLLSFSFVFSLVYTLFTLTISEEISAILSDSAVLCALQVAISVISFIGVFGITYKIAGYRISDLVPLKKTEKGLSLPVFFFGVAFCSFSNIASNLLASFFYSLGIDYSSSDIDMPKGIFGFLLTLISTAIVPALVEEFAFRGLVMGSLKKYGSGFAVISSAILFGLIHGNFEQIPFAFLMGLFLGYSVIITGSLRIAICVHFFNNFISVVFSFIPNSISVEIQNVIYAVFLLLSLVAGIICLNSKSDKKLFEFEKSDTECKESQKYKWFFLSVATAIAIVLCLIQAVLGI